MQDNDNITLNITPVQVLSTQISPVDLTDGFEDEGAICFFHDLISLNNDSSALVPIAPYGIWAKRGDEITIEDPAKVDPRASVALARLAGSLERIAPFSHVGSDMDPDFNTQFRAYYYRSCVVITWADVSYAVQFMNDSIADDDFSPFTTESLLANVFTAKPQSSHQELMHIQQLRTDLEAHARILSEEHQGIVMGEIRDAHCEKPREEFPILFSLTGRAGF